MRVRQILDEDSEVTTGNNDDDDDGTEAAAEVLRGNPPMHNFVKRRWDDDVQMLCSEIRPS